MDQTIMTEAIVPQRLLAPHRIMRSHSIDDWRRVTASWEPIYKVNALFARMRTEKQRVENFVNSDSEIATWLDGVESANAGILLMLLTWTLPDYSLDRLLAALGPADVLSYIEEPERSRYREAIFPWLDASAVQERPRRPRKRTSWPRTIARALGWIMHPSALVNAIAVYGIVSLKSAPAMYIAMKLFGL